MVEQAKELNSLRESKAQLEKKSAQLRLLVDKTNQVIAVQQVCVLTMCMCTRFV